jgi:hypothetical protein
MTYIMAEQQADGYWTVQTEFLHLGCGATRHTAVMRARDAHPSVMQHFPLQPEEIPGELREIARRMLAVGQGVETCRALESGWPTARQMVRWAESVEDWADGLESLAFPPPGA